MKIADLTLSMPYIIWVTSLPFKFILKLEAKLNSEFGKNRSALVMLIPTVSLRTHCSSCLSSGNIKADHLVIGEVIIQFLICIAHQSFCKQGRMLGRSSLLKG